MELKDKIAEIINLPKEKQDSAMDALLEKYSKAECKSALKSIIANSENEVLALKRQRVVEQLSEVAGIISFSYIATQYFKKSKSWLSQRINGTINNGKPCEFSPEEIETLNEALQDISKKISACVVK